MENTNTEIQIKDNYAGGEYSNVMEVRHNKEEFLLTFLNIVPPGGRVCGKIIITPAHMKRMTTALEENLKKYEAQFGAIEAAENPKSNIGFQVE